MNDLNLRSKVNQMAQTIEKIFHLQEKSYEFLEQMDQHLIDRADKHDQTLGLFNNNIEALNTTLSHWLVFFKDTLFPKAYNIFIILISAIILLSGLKAMDLFTGVK